MGCNKSGPVQLNFAHGSDEVILRPIKKSNFIVQETGAISDYFEVLKALDSTDTFTMFLARDKHSGIYRTVKEVSKFLTKDSARIYEEVRILGELDHPNILKIIKTIETPRSYYIVYENIEGESIKTKLKKGGNEGIISKLMLEVLAAINYMHDSGIIHCDLSTDNIIIAKDSSESTPKIVGFGFAQKADELHEIDLKLINHQFTSPDMLQEKFDSQTDIYSIGVVLYFLLTGRLPYQSRDKFGLLEAIYSGILDFDNPAFSSLSSDAKDLIKQMLEVNPKKRITAKQVLAHIWMQQSKKPSSLTYDIVHKMRSFKVSFIYRLKQILLEQLFLIIP